MNLKIQKGKTAAWKDWIPQSSLLSRQSNLQKMWKQIEEKCRKKTEKKDKKEKKNEI